MRPGKWGLSLPWCASGSGPGGGGAKGDNQMIKMKIRRYLGLTCKVHLALRRRIPMATHNY